MFRSKRLEKLTHRDTFAALGLFKPPADAAKTLEHVLIIQKPLIGVRALDYNLGFRSA